MPAGAVTAWSCGMGQCTAGSIRGSPNIWLHRDVSLDRLKPGFQHRGRTV